MIEVLSLNMSTETFAIGLALLVHLATQFREPTSLEFLISFTCFNLLQIYFFHTSFNQSILEAIYNSSRSSAIFLVTIFSSILVYRLLFHRLNRFPGPKSLIASKWAMVPIDLRGQRPYLMQKLHQKHGNIVRFGPRELSINDPEDLSSIYGAGAKTDKGPLYYFMRSSGHNPSNSVLTVPTMAEHSRLRKNWDSSFSIRALKGYEECLSRNVELAISQVSNFGKDQKSVAIDEIVSWFAFDVMGELGFNKSFGNLKEGKTVKAIKLIQEAIVLTMAIGNLPYLADLLRLLPNPMLVLDSWISRSLTERLESLPESGDNPSDIISHLIKENKSLDTKKLSFRELQAESGLIVVGGSDTSSNTIALALFHLIQEPGAYQKVQQEVEQCFSGSIVDDFNRLAKECPYLNAVIQETLRLWPPVASGLQRLTPPEGLLLKSGVHIPGNVVLSTPTFVLHRDPRNFSHPNEFRPERWMESSSESVHNSKAFSAFGFGPTSCVGRNLGLMELRLFIARFVQTFDATFARGFDPVVFTASIKDYFLITKDPILVNVKHRQA